MFRYVQDYVEPQSIISSKDLSDLTTGPNRWGPGFSNFAFTFGDTSVFIYNTDGANITASASNNFNNLTIFKWCIFQNVGGGDSISLTSTSATGTGKLGLANHSLVLKVTDEETYFNLSAYKDSKQIFKLDNKVTVRFDHPEPSEEGQLFAVFRNEDGSLTAFPTRYDAVSGELVFSGDKLGNFVVVSVNYDGKLYTKEFYNFLETIESVRDLKYGL